MVAHPISEQNGASRGESPKSATEELAQALPNLRQLGVAKMTPDELARLARQLELMAQWVSEIRFLYLERRHRLLQDIPNRPTIGYYLHLAQDAAMASTASPPPNSRAFIS